MYYKKILDKDLPAICASKTTLKLNKQTYVGISILDLNKVLMYEIHYDYIKNKCGNKSPMYKGKIKNNL